MADPRCMSLDDSGMAQHNHTVALRAHTEIGQGPTKRRYRQESTGKPVDAPSRRNETQRQRSGARRAWRQRRTDPGRVQANQRIVFFTDISAFQLRDFHFLISRKMKTKIVDQGELARHLGLTARRIRQLEDDSVISRGHDNLYDVENCERRYRAFREGDRVAASYEIERLAREVSREMNKLLAVGDIEERRRLAKRIGPLMGELDGQLLLAAAMGPAGPQREFERSYVNMLSGQMFSDLLTALQLKMTDHKPPGNKFRRQNRYHCPNGILFALRLKTSGYQGRSPWLGWCFTLRKCPWRAA
jgi:hypothetical protein